MGHEFTQAFQVSGSLHLQRQFERPTAFTRPAAGFRYVIIHTVQNRAV